MELSIGQRVAYPGQGVCEVEKIEMRRVGETNIECCLLRVALSLRPRRRQGAQTQLEVVCNRAQYLLYHAHLAEL